MSKAVLRYRHRAHGDCLRALRMLWRGGCTPKVKIQSAFDWVTIACPPQTRCTWTCTEHDRSSTRSGLQQRAQRAVQWRALAHFGCTVVWQRCRAQLPRYGRKCQRVPCKLSAIETQRLDVHSCREGVLAQVKLNGLTQIAISSGYQSHSRSIGERSRLTSNSPLPKASLHKLSMHTLPHICPSVAL